MHPMKGTILFGCLLFLFCGHGFPQGHVVFRPCSGVMINGVCWAESNVDSAGTFAAAPEACGMLYQWNQRKEGPCPAGPPTQGADPYWTAPNSKAANWEAANDPCPPGWRMPTAGEYALIKRSQVDVVNISRNGTDGIEVRDKMTGNAIFLPSMCTSTDNWLGRYWSGSSSSDSKGVMFCWNIPSYDYNRAYGKEKWHSVRCVADWAVADCDSIVKDTSVTICAGDLPYTWGNTVFPAGTKAGIYRFRYSSTARGCDSIVRLHLAVNPVCDCPGVSVNGVCWAESNVDSVRTFAAVPEAYGMFYQWNDTVAVPVTDGSAGWSPIPLEYPAWDPAKDPCPAGWRTPTVEEMKTLVDGTKVIAVRASRNGVRGREYTDKLTGNAVFLPAAEFIASGGLHNSVCDVSYWTSSSSPKVWVSGLQCDGINGSLFSSLGLSVRCVADGPLTNCDSIVRDTSVTICAGDLPYVWGDTVVFGGRFLYESGIYSDTLLSVTGCDSIVRLHLTVLPASRVSFSDAVCSGSGYRENGFDVPVVYADTLICDTLQNHWGCDSVRLLYLTALPVYDVQLSGVLCEGGRYIGQGFDVSRAGVHYRYLKTVASCDSTLTLNLTEEKKTEGRIGLLPEDCSIHSYVFFFESGIPLYSWWWDMGDGTVLRTEEGIHAYADSGVYRIRLRTETYNGCKDTFSYVQRVPPYLSDVRVYADRQVIDSDNPTVRFRAEVLPEMTCLWDFGDGGTGEGDSVSHTYDVVAEKYYHVTLKVINADSCITESRMRIEMAVSSRPANTFSPNGDGVNDIFMQGYRIEIMNRNGLRIYTGDDGWDGTSKGTQVPQDTYFYRLYYRTGNEEKVKTGYVTLIR